MVLPSLQVQASFEQKLAAPKRKQKLLKAQHVETSMGLLGSQPAEMFRFQTRIERQGDHELM